MTSFLTRPVGELLTKNPFVDNYKKMWPFVKPYWFRALLGLALALPVGALDATVAMFMKYYTDDVLVAKDAAASLSHNAMRICCASLSFSTFFDIEKVWQFSCFL